MADQPTPTPEQVKRYKELRDSGVSALDATRIVRAMAKDSNTGR